MTDCVEIIKCPACGKEMKKIDIPETKVNVNVCVDGCGGFYFYNREFKNFVEKNENLEYVFSQLKDKNFTQIDCNEVVTCPACDVSMTKMGAVGGKVVINVCNICGSTFLHNNEFQKFNDHNEDNPDLENQAEELDEYISKGTPPQIQSSTVRKFFENMVKRYI